MHPTLDQCRVHAKFKIVIAYGNRYKVHFIKRVGSNNRLWCIIMERVGSNQATIIVKYTTKCWHKPNIKEELTQYFTISNTTKRVQRNKK